MRVMVLVKADKDSEAGIMPSEDILTKMGAYNEELVKAGVMLAGEGLHPTSKGLRMRFSGSERTITDGPFAETREHLGGFYLIDAPNLDAAIILLSSPCGNAGVCRKGSRAGAPRVGAGRKRYGSIARPRLLASGGGNACGCAAVAREPGRGRALANGARSKE